jgi:hypothetical protein
MTTKGAIRLVANWISEAIPVSADRLLSDYLKGIRLDLPDDEHRIICETLLDALGYEVD